MNGRIRALLIVKQKNHMSPITGFLLPFRGLSLIFKPGIRAYVLIPLLMNITVFSGLAWVAGVYFEEFMGQYLPEDSWFSFIRPLLWFIFAAAYALALFYSFTIIANLLASPFNGVLAAKVEEKLTGKLPIGAELSIVASIAPAISGELNKIAYFLKRAIPLFLLFIVSSFIPGLNLVVTLLWVLFGFWFLTIEYVDYSMGNYDITPQDQRSKLKKRRVQSFAFGAGVTVMMLIPILQFLAMPAAVAGGTKFWVDALKDID